MVGIKVGNVGLVGALLAAVLLAGCGGGGGGAGVDDVPPSQVSISKPTIMPITGTRVTSDKFSNFVLTGTVSGNLSVIKDDIHVEVTDAAGLFVPGALFIQGKSSGNPTYELVIYGDTLTKAGHFAGNLRIKACLDRACTQPIGGTPILVPYDVTVHAVLALSRKDITISVPFGTVPPREIIDVTISPFGKNWTARIATPYDPYAGPNTVGVIQSYQELHTDKQLQLEVFPAKPGVRSEIFKLHSNAFLPDGRQIDAEETVTVNYTVTPNPAVDHVFYPAVLNITQKQQTLMVEHAYRIVTNTGVVAHFAGIEYPTNTGTTGPINSWWSEGASKRVHTCTFPMTATSCLAPGLHTARVKYRLVSAGGERVVSYPINLTVTN